MTPSDFLISLKSLYLQQAIPGSTFVGLLYYFEKLTLAVRADMKKSTSKTQDHMKHMFDQLQWTVTSLPEMSDYKLDELLFKQVSDPFMVEGYIHNGVPVITFKANDEIRRVTFDDKNHDYVVEDVIEKSKSPGFSEDWSIPHTNLVDYLERNLVDVRKTSLSVFKFHGNTPVNSENIMEARITKKELNPTTEQYVAEPTVLRTTAVPTATNSIAGGKVAELQPPLTLKDKFVNMLPSNMPPWVMLLIILISVVAIVGFVGLIFWGIKKSAVNEALAAMNRSQLAPSVMQPLESTMQSTPYYRSTY
jgi:hypothetical protein